MQRLTSWCYFPSGLSCNDILNTTCFRNSISSKKKFFKSSELIKRIADITRKKWKICSSEWQQKTLKAENKWERKVVDNKQKTYRLGECLNRTKETPSTLTLKSFKLVGEAHDVEENNCTKSAAADIVRDLCQGHYESICSD